MTKLLSVVETPAYLSKASKLLNENERAAVVDMIVASPNLGVRDARHGWSAEDAYPVDGAR